MENFDELEVNHEESEMTFRNRPDPGYIPIYQFPLGEKNSNANWDIFEIQSEVDEIGKLCIS